MAANGDAFITPDWPAPPSVKALMTTRGGGVSTGPYASLNLGTRVGDAAANVARNRLIVREHLPQFPQWLAQEHGANVVAAHDPGDVPVADAAWTDRPGVVCAVLVADCLPVLFCDRAGTAVGIAHAGWRGLAGGVIERTVEAMPGPARDLMAWLGPAIGPEAFEVGQDVYDAFVQRDAASSVAFRRRPDGKYLADLYALARQRLGTAGITAAYGGGFCTATEAERFFSYRRDKVTGRMAVLVWMQ
jgi:YfiH family protein